MSQPKSQLVTFKAWAGEDSDIHYLSPHRVDIYESIVPSYRPVKRLERPRQGPGLRPRHRGYHLAADDVAEDGRAKQSRYRRVCRLVDGPAASGRA